MTNPLAPVIDQFRTIRDAIRVTIRILDAGGDKRLADGSKIDTNFAGLQPTDFTPLTTWAITTKHAAIHGVPNGDLVKRLREQVVPGLDRVAVVELAGVFELTLRNHLRDAALAWIPSATGEQVAFREAITEELEWWKLKERLLDIFPAVDSIVRMQAKQVIERRNWVAHGKHTDAKWPEPTYVSAEDAFQRLTDYLKVAGIVT